MTHSSKPTKPLPSTTLKEWYNLNYTNETEDTDSEFLNPYTTFEDLYIAIENGGSMYQTTGTISGLVWDNLFEGLSLCTGIPKSKLKALWANTGEIATIH